MYSYSSSLQVTVNSVSVLKLPFVFQHTRFISTNDLILSVIFRKRNKTRSIRKNYFRVQVLLSYLYLGGILTVFQDGTLQTDA